MFHYRRPISSLFHFFHCSLRKSGCTDLSEQNVTVVTESSFLSEDGQEFKMDLESFSHLLFYSVTSHDSEEQQQAITHGIESALLSVKASQPPHSA